MLNSKPNISAQEFIGISDITDDGFLKGREYTFAYIWVKSQNVSLLAASEKDAFFEKLVQGVSVYKQPWQLISMPRVVNTRDLINRLLVLRKNTDNEQKLDLLNNEIMALQDMARNGLKEAQRFIKLWIRNGNKAEETLKQRRSDLITSLVNNGVEAQAFTKQDVVYICKQFAELGQHQTASLSDSYNALPQISGKKKITKTEDTQRLELIDMITPSGGIRFKNNGLVIGDMTARCLYASSFPSSLKKEWATEMMSCTDAVTAITFNPGNSGALADALSKSIRQNIIEAGGSNDARSQKAFMRQAESADKLIDRIDANNEIIGKMSILVMPFTDNEDNIGDICRHVSEMYSANHIRLRIAGQLQKECFKAISPYGVPNREISDLTERIMPLYTLMGGAPMTVNTLKDDNGFYFAKTADGGMMAIDYLFRGGDRTNSNFVITGSPGTGKSTAIKHILESMYMSGWKVVIIDPESEYKDMCRKLNGTWLDAGGGKAKSNVLQIRSVPMDDEDESDGENLFDSSAPPLANHLRTVETFIYTYIPSLSDLQKALLNQALVELYGEFNIEWDTDVSNLTAEQYPTFSDLYQLLTLKAKKDDRYSDLASLFYSIAEGSDSFLWNGVTNINIDSDFVVFDTNKLAGASEKIQATQYFNLLTQAWEIMSEDRSRPVILVCDEAYLMVDDKCPQSLMYLRNISKRCRKYSGALAVISHSLIDFLSEDIRRYAQSLLESPTYKIFFGTNGKNLKETATLYDLSDEEQMILQAGIRGEALAIIGRQRCKVLFEIPEYKLRLMGKGGGA